METFSLKPRVCFGSEALTALETLPGPVLIITDRFLAKSGLLDLVRPHLKGGTAIFDEVTPDPSLELVAKGVLALEGAKAQSVLAFGGGSPMDCAKAVRYFSGQSLPLWCVPTTAGTGSEVTSFAVLTDTAKGAKYALVDDTLLPDGAVLDPGFLTGVPAGVTADTGMDVLTHTAEAYVARGANAFTDALAEAAFETAFRRLPDAYRGDMEARAALLEASCMAGMAFNAAGLGICHSLAHALGGAYHLPHGKINAILLPHIIIWHAGAVPAAASKYARLAKRCGLAPTARALAAGLGRLARSLGEPDRFPEAMDIPRIAAQAMTDRCTPSDPASVTEADLQQILEAVK